MTLLRHLMENFWDFDPSALNPSDQPPKDRYSSVEIKKLSDEELEKLDKKFDRQMEKHGRHINRADQALEEFIAHNQSKDLVMAPTPSSPTKPGFVRYMVPTVHGGNFDVREGTDLHQQLDRLVKSHKLHDKKWEHFHQLSNRVGTEIRYRQKQRKQQTKKAAAGIIQQKQRKASTASIPNPKQLSFTTTAGKTFRMDNPYHKDKSGGKDAFAGHPAHYQSWTSQMAAMYVEIDGILHRNGKPTLSQMHAGRQNNISFVVSANDNFVWRKYDPSPGAGQNWVIINGKKMNTSVLINVSAQQQDAMVANV